MQRRRTFRQLGFVDADIRIIVVLKTFAVFIHDLQRLGGHRLIVVIAHRHDKARNDLVALDERLLEVAVHRLPVCDRLRIKSFVHSAVRIKCRVARIGVDFHVAPIHTVVQLDLDLCGGFCFP